MNFAKWVAVAVVTGTLGMLVAQDADASRRRLGGGGNKGVQREQTAPPPAVTPAAPAAGAAAPNAAARPAKRGTSGCVKSSEAKLFEPLWRPARRYFGGHRAWLHALENGIGLGLFGPAADAIDWRRRCVRGDAFDSLTQAGQYL
jgi:hypothetical protein